MIGWSDDPLYCSSQTPRVFLPRSLVLVSYCIIIHLSVDVRFIISSVGSVMFVFLLNGLFKSVDLVTYCIFACCCWCSCCYFVVLLFLSRVKTLCLLLLQLLIPELRDARS